jgi:hypothetical protein
MSIIQLLNTFIVYCLIPLWIAVGFADWLCHRASDISRTAGAKESALHLLMLAEIGIPLLAGLFLEINALVLLIMLAGLLAHEATSLWDLQYAHSKRDISPIEQHVHSFQEVIPMILFALVSFLNWEQFTALLAWRSDAEFLLEWNRTPLPATYLATVLCLTALFVGLPFVEEFLRALQVGRMRDTVKSGARFGKFR